MSNDIDEYLSFSSDDDYLSADSSSNTSLCDIMPLSDKLSEIFKNNSTSLSLVHINTQSLLAHYTDLLTSFSTGVVDCILVSETWLKPSLPSTSCSLPGYQLFRNDRTDRGGGGVGIYLRSTIPAKTVLFSQASITGSLEYLFLELVVHYKKILLGVVYSPNDKINYFTDLEIILDRLLPTYDYFICMGDLNTCLLKNDSRAQALKNLTSSFNLHILSTTLPTHFFPNCRPSLIDLIIVSNHNLVASHGQLTAPFSYHDLVYLAYKLRTPKVRGKIHFLRNFKHMDLERLREDVKNIDWTPVLKTNDIDSMVESLTAELIKLYDVHAPVRPVRRKHMPAPWLTQVIRSTMLKRDKAKLKFKKCPSPEKLIAYKKLRNICNRMCRDAKRRYIHSTVQDLCQTQVWRFLQSFGVGKTKDANQVSLDLNVLNNYFTKPPITMNAQIKTDTLAHLSHVVPPDCIPFVLKTVTEDIVKKGVRSLSTRAIGCDKLSLDMILPVLDDIAPVITHIINFSLTCNVFPALWKKASVIPLPKISNPTTPNDYRPISILPILSKVLESIVHDQLYIF